MKRILKLSLVGAGVAGAVTGGIFLVKRIRNNRHEQEVSELRNTTQLSDSKEEESNIAQLTIEAGVVKRK